MGVGVAGADLGPGRGCRGPPLQQGPGHVSRGVPMSARVSVCVCVCARAYARRGGVVEKYSFKKVTLFPCGCIPLARPFVWAHG